MPVDTARVHDETADLLAEVGDKTLVDVFMATCDANGGRPALVIKQDESFVTHTWNDYRRQASHLAAALIGHGIGRGDHVALMMTNRPEHVIADVGVMLSAATPVSVYSTLTVDQIVHIADNASVSTAVVEDVATAQRWLDVADKLPTVSRIVIVDPDGEVSATVDFDRVLADPRVTTWEEVLAAGRRTLDEAPTRLEAVWRTIEADDAATVIYTSGTTGPPKGVVLTHRNILCQLAAIQRLLPLDPGQRGLSYLPLAHVAERMVTHYLGIRHGGTVFFVKDTADVVATMLEAKPQLFMAVPRVWEKMHAAILARIEEDPRKAPIARKALAVGMAVAEARQNGDTVPMGLRAQHALFDRLVFSKIRSGLGLDEVRYAVSGAAPISPQLLTFFAAIGLEILEVYGMTETTALISANRPGQTRFGTVGPAMPGIELRFETDGEILVRGPAITPGYLRQPEATDEAFDQGWLRTGDLGTIDEDGAITIVGRTKELIITAGGKNVAPNLIEQSIKGASSIIGQICTVGDQRPFLGALIVLDADLLRSWAATHGVAFTSVAEMAEHPDVLADVQRAVDEGNEQLSRVEQVKRWVVLADEWTAESEELTPSMKLRRDVIHRRHAEAIDALYAN